MAGDLKLDYERMGELQRNLNTALTVLNHDVESAWDLQSVVGDARLGRAARDFSDSWDKHRLDIRDRLQWLHDSIKNIQEQFAQVDTDLANGLANPQAGTSGGGRTTARAV
ncbi:MAG: hypothetical protein DI534_06400 [Leifsonia xyli]|nr:MAG: hypothetical protein DI534_06400 [Leifsonia xyli]